MVNQEQSGQGRSAATAQERPGSDEDISPRDEIRGESAAERQKGQPGIPDPNEPDWSPGSGGEK